MERLTIRNSDGSVSQPTVTTIQAVFKKLAAYEDTGLEPADIEELQAKVPQWISVEERLPERTNPTHARDTYLVRLESGCIKTLSYEYDNSDRCRPGMSPIFDEGWAKTVVPVTHWMELPKFEPPKGGNHDN